MKQWIIRGAAAVLLLAMTGCTVQPAENVPEEPPIILREPELEKPSEPEVAPQPEPEPEPMPEPEPPEEQPLPAGPTVQADGVACETALAGETVLISADALERAGLTVTVENTSVTVGWLDRTAMVNLYRVADESLQPCAVVRCETVYLPLEWTAQQLQLGYLDDRDVSGQIYLTPAAGSFAVVGGKRIPILMYHACSDDVWGIEGLFVSPVEMEKQLAYLNDNGYQTITYEDWSHLEDFDKPVMLTFDDGYEDNYTELYPLLAQYQCKATVFVIAGSIGNNRYMTAEQIKEVSDSGWISIQSHTQRHLELDALNESALVREMEESKRTLMEITGKIPFVVSYPNGKYDDLSNAVSARYYTFGIRKNGGVCNTSQNRFEITRSQILRSTSVNRFGEMIDVH